jgi:hypothetical protein
MAAPLNGVVPVMPTIFHDDETVDLGGAARAAGVSQGCSRQGRLAGGSGVAARDR